MEAMDFLGFALFAVLAIVSIVAIGMGLFRHAELRAQPGLSEQRRKSQRMLVVATLIVGGSSLALAVGLAVSMSL